MSDAATWGKPIAAAVVTSIIVYIQITIITLTVSYTMNRSIYRSTSLRVLTGILAGLTALITFWVILFLPKTHYFGFFPLLGPIAEAEKRWGILNYFRSSYDPTEHVGIVRNLVMGSLGWRKDGEKWTNSSGAQPLEYMEGGAPPTEGVVNEARGEAARAAGAISDKAEWGTTMAEFGRYVTKIAAARAAAAAFEAAEAEKRAATAAAAAKEAEEAERVAAAGPVTESGARSSGPLTYGDLR